MGLLDEYTKITCEKYEKVSDDNRKCQHYGKGGRCKLPTEFMCVEWLKLNANKKTKEERDNRIELEIPSDKKVEENKDSNGNDVKLERPRVVIARTGKNIQPYVIPEDEIEKLKLKGMEIRLSAEEFDEDVWIVPKETEQSDKRLEITYDDAATLCTILSVFPDSKVVRLRRKPLKK